MTMEDRPLFGAGNVSWRVLRQPIYLLGGMRALLLQLAHPNVAEGVLQHSDFVGDVFGRTRRTLDLMLMVGLGEREQADAALERMHAVHARVRGTLPDGSAYDARDPELQLWVLATLIDTVLVVEERFLGEFGPEDRRRYYLESCQVARVFGIPEELIPPDLDTFRRYVDRHLDTLEVSDTAQRLSRFVLRPRFRFLPDLVFVPFRLVTAEMLPERLRAAYGLRRGWWRRRAVKMVERLTRAVVPRLPESVRTFPVLHPALGLRYRLRQVAGRVRRRREPPGRPFEPAA
ncbi:MAG: oxygenase MpaB family protein [Acidimicrobiia bacterium]